MERPQTALDYAQQVMEIAGAMIPIVGAGVQVVSLLSAGASAVAAMQADNRDPTDAEWAALDADGHAKLAELQAL